MAIKKFPSLEAALAAGYHIDLGNGEYAQGGETVPRERYQALFEAVGAAEPAGEFKLPNMMDLRPLLGEVKQRLVDGEIRKMVWNGEKWLFYADVYPLMYYAQTGAPLVLEGDDKRVLW